MKGQAKIKGKCAYCSSETRNRFVRLCLACHRHKNNNCTRCKKKCFGKLCYSCRSYGKHYSNKAKIPKTL